MSWVKFRHVSLFHMFFYKFAILFYFISLTIDISRATSGLFFSNLTNLFFLIKLHIFPIIIVNIFFNITNSYRMIRNFSSFNPAVTAFWKHLWSSFLEFMIDLLFFNHSKESCKIRGGSRTAARAPSWVLEQS